MTITEQVAVFVPQVALIVTPPGATGVTTPSSDTVAILVSALSHVIGVVAVAGVLLAVMVSVEPSATVPEVGDTLRAVIAGARAVSVSISCGAAKNATSVMRSPAS